MWTRVKRGTFQPKSYHFNVQINNVYLSATQTTPPPTLIVWIDRGKIRKACRDPPPRKPFWQSEESSECCCCRRLSASATCDCVGNRALRQRSLALHTCLSLLSSGVTGEADNRRAIVLFQRIRVRLKARGLNPARHLISLNIICLSYKLLYTLKSAYNYFSQTNNNSYY